MDLYEFDALNEDQQAEFVWQWGDYLMNREEGPSKVALYQLGHFYAEIWYDKKDNRITRLRSFASIDALAPYLRQIELPCFF